MAIVMMLPVMLGRSGSNCLCLLRSKIHSLHSKAQYLYVSTRQYKSKSEDTTKIGDLKLKQRGHGYITYKKMQENRRSQAKRSFLINTSAIVNVPYIYRHCMQYGKINYICHFKDEKHKVLVEYASHSSVAQLLSNASHFVNSQNVPVQSRLFHYLAYDRVDQAVEKFQVFTVEAQKLDMSKLGQAESLSDQMKTLHSSQKLRDLDIRLCFLVCSYLEEALSGLFPHCSVEPFGSSVNGFGKSGCDLDMELEFLPRSVNSNQNGLSRCMKFRTSRHQGSEREFAQQMLHLLGDIIQKFLPSCIGVQQILQARVPIVKFLHGASNVECDLCFKNPSAAVMSELLYFLGELDDRVRPLMATVKEWARAKNITRANPGPWPSNFTLTMMVLFFLQSRRQPVLPTFKQLQNLADPADKYIIDGTNSSFTSDLSRLPDSQNDEDLGELLLEFFNFFSTFDFHKYALSLRDGSVCAKPDHTPLHIPNLFERGHNISRNVNDSELLNLRQAMETAVFNLETELNSKRSNWGLLSILKEENEHQIHMKVNYLFSQDAENATTVSNLQLNSKKSSQNLEQNSDNVQYSKESFPQKTVDSEIVSKHLSSQESGYDSSEDKGCGNSKAADTVH